MKIWKIKDGKKHQEKKPQQKLFHVGRGGRKKRKRKWKRKWKMIKSDAWKEKLTFVGFKSSLTRFNASPTPWWQRRKPSSSHNTHQRRKGEELGGDKGWGRGMGWKWGVFSLQEVKASTNNTEEGIAKEFKLTRPSRPIGATCGSANECVTNRQTDRPTDGHSQL